MNQASNSDDRSIRDIVRTATGYYAHSIIPRAVVVAIPYVGGTIDRLLSGYATRRWQEKVVSMFEELRRNLENLDERSINKKFIQSAEFEGLIIRIIQALQTAHEHEKISYFANILTKVVTTPSLQNENAQRYIRLIDELTGLHIRILRVFAEKPKDMMRAPAVAKIIGGNGQEIEAYCSDLEAHSLLHNPSIGTFNGGPGNYKLHPSAVPFIEFLSTSKSQSDT